MMHIGLTDLVRSNILDNPVAKTLERCFHSGADTRTLGCRDSCRTLTRHQTLIETRCRVYLLRPLRWMG